VASSSVLASAAGSSIVRLASVAVASSWLSRATRRFRVVANSRQKEVCQVIHQQGLCPSLCREVGGCFLPREGDHPSEARRKVFRCQRAVDALVKIRTGGNHAGQA
jgi:hypothetical protein